MLADVNFKQWRFRITNLFMNLLFLKRIIFQNVAIVFKMSYPFYSFHVNTYFPMLEDDSFSINE